ncbi:MAG: ABC-ATPase domain-containing protein [Deltaproteobacteria bacterium]|nr:ABC-ATPase domain-containing protein [Deltaproteobacteria bacterium]
MDRLREILRRIDGHGYRAYREVLGTYRAGEMELRVDHVQGDPFAEPSRLALRVPLHRTWVPAELAGTPLRRVALGDLVTRIFHRALEAVPGGGADGGLQVEVPGQEVLPRSSCVVDGEALELRFRAGLPADGRRVLGDLAWEMLGGAVPAAAIRSLAPGMDLAGRARRHVEALEDAAAARAALRPRGLVAFVAQGSILPRRSGVDPRPLERGAVPFGPIPGSLRVVLDLPHQGAVEGLGIPAGVTVIVGGGYHGKSTLLAALALGVYDHVPGDGRELVVTDGDAVTVRAEDGRRVEALDISPFARSLPGGRSVRAFSTPDASGSTSQAAAIVEALEVGARVLLVDEDTSATNFMIRDARMQRLVDRADEPIVPLLDQVRGLHERRGVSTVLVAGGSGDWLDVADTVIQMREFRPLDVTAAAREVCAALPAARACEGDWRGLDAAPRRVLPRSFDPRRGARAEAVRSRGLRTLLFGEEEVDLAGVEQLVTPAQTRFIGDVLLHIHGHLTDGQRDVRGLVEAALDAYREGGFDRLARVRVGDRAAARVFEIAAAINRLRSLAVAPEA